MGFGEDKDMVPMHREALGQISDKIYFSSLNPKASQVAANMFSYKPEGHNTGRERGIALRYVEKNLHRLHGAYDIVEVSEEMRIARINSNTISS
jgi:hypothetical protein